MLIRSNKQHNGNSDAVQINNTINYYYPDKEDEYNINVNEEKALLNLIKKTNMYNKTKAIADVLKSFKVNPKPIKCNSYEEFYNKFIILKKRQIKGNNDIY